VTFIGTTSIIPFLPDAWAKKAGGLPIMTLPTGFLMKDVLFLLASFYPLKRDLTRAAQEMARDRVLQPRCGHRCSSHPYCPILFARECFLASKLQCLFTLPTIQPERFDLAKM